MLVNTKWLLEYLEPQCSHEDVLEALPRIGLEIEQLHPLRSELENVRIGFIREKVPLTGTKGMYACRVEVEHGQTILIVCASEHEVQVGWGVPVATAGVKLPTGKTIAASHFHGASSEGMICLDGELGLLARGSGLQVFHDEAALGSPLPSLVDISEYLVEVDVLPNRADCLGLIGIAREVSAILGLKLCYPADTKPLEKPRNGDQIVPVEICEPQLCPRYTCQLIRAVKIAPSPHWLKSRLLAVGLRPINNVVDVTNFVLHEWGQPLHAFDYGQLRGGRIVVRRMKPGETIELLSGKVVDSSTSPLVIADADRPVALAGIMGGRDTEINETTVEVLLEVAHFEPVNIRNTANKTDIGLDSRGTASSYCFERGTDPNRMLQGALRRATSLIGELGGATVDAPPTDEYPVRLESRSFRLTPKEVEAYLGTPVDAHTIRDLLQRLEMTCSKSLHVTVPTWRVDANDRVVLIEDVARLIGYDQIPTEPNATLPTIGVRCASDRLRQAIAQHLAAAGYLECCNPSLESPQAAAILGPSAEQGDITITNPMSREMSALRRSLLPKLLRCAERNLRRGVASIRLFEIDRVFWLSGDKPIPQDRWYVAGIVGGVPREHDWRAKDAKLDFHDVKGLVESLLELAGVRNCSFQPLETAPYVPGAAAVVLTSDKTVGCVGELSQGLIDTGKVLFRPFAFELDLAALEPHFLQVPSAQPMARTPAVTRDLAVVVRAEEAFAGIEEEIRRSAGPALEALRLVDRYQGPQVPPDHQSFAFRLVFRDPSCTLTTEYVSEVMDGIIESLSHRFGAQLRK